MPKSLIVSDDESRGTNHKYWFYPLNHQLRLNSYSFHIKQKRGRNTNGAVYYTICFSHLTAGELFQEHLRSRQGTGRTAAIEVIGHNISFQQR